ncbi:MAG: ATP-binding protein [Spirochaetia bacterium]
MRLELTGGLSLNEEEQSLLTMHSVLNVMNTVMMELLNLSDIVGSHPALEQAQDVVIRVADDLRDSERAGDHLTAADTLARELTDLIGKALSSHSGAAEREDVKESLAGLDQVFGVLKVRAQELVDRAADPDMWVEYEIEALKRNFLEVFAAIEQNSHGGYRIVFNLATHEEGDYFVDLEMSSFRGNVIRIPAVLQDVMRDLIANARKYTAPGGRIMAGLDENTDRLRFVVEDSGRGIPAEELPHVIDFGYRGTNVQDRPTRGGGFGLTKAFHVTRRLGGHMWIESEPGGGTRVEIEIPQTGT